MTPLRRTFFSLRLHIIVSSVFMLMACSSTLRNPGEEETLSMQNSGDCKAASMIALPAANRGEPWAQYRVGSLLISCNPSDVQQGLSWLRRVAEFKPSSAWERGEQESSGPAGFFNARKHVTSAVHVLSKITLAQGKPKDAWLMLARTRQMYRREETDFAYITESMQNIEKHVSPGTVAHWAKALAEAGALP